MTSKNAKIKILKEKKSSIRWFTYNVKNKEINKTYPNEWPIIESQRSCGSKQIKDFNKDSQNGYLKFTNPINQKAFEYMGYLENSPSFGISENCDYVAFYVCDTKAYLKEYMCINFQKINHFILKIHQLKAILNFLHFPSLQLVVLTSYFRFSCRSLRMLFEPFCEFIHNFVHNFRFGQCKEISFTDSRILILGSQFPKT